MSKSAHGAKRRTSKTSRSTNPKAEQRGTIDALHESERFIRQITELSPVVLYVFALVTERHTYLRSNTVNLFGYTADEIAHMKDHYAVLVHPEDVPRVRDNLARYGYSPDKRWLRKNGNIIYATISVKCLRRADSSVDYFVALLQDITARKRADESSGSG